MSGAAAQPPNSGATGPSTFTVRESADAAKRRFEVECEFVQALANPHYLNYLAQRGYFKEDYFVNYLKYLLYFKRPDHARTLKFPQCLFLLEALQSAEFREEMASTANARYIEDQQMLQWHFYIRKRQRLQQFSQIGSDQAQQSCDPTALVSGKNEEKGYVPILPPKSSEQSKSLEPLKPSEQPKPSELPETSETSEPSEPSEISELPKPLELPKTSETSEPLES